MWGSPLPKAKLASTKQSFASSVFTHRKVEDGKGIIRKKDLQQGYQLLCDGSNWKEKKKWFGTET